MPYMILRRADARTEAGGLPPAEAGLLDVVFAPTEQAVRLTIRDGQVTVKRGPFDDTVAGFTMVASPTIPDAVEWLRRWPAADAEDDTDAAVTLEIRQRGCPDNCAAIDLTGEGAGERYAILLRSNEALETEVPVEVAKITALDAHNAREFAAGTLLAADGLRGTSRGARVRVAKSVFSVIDGPFTEIKELIAGFWLIRAKNMDEAIAWASRNPYPTGPDVEVEIRPVLATRSFGADLATEESRLRAGQLDAGMRAHFTA